MGTRFVTASEFQANCVTYLNDLGKDAESITITRKGNPVGVLSPIQEGPKTKKRAWGSARKNLKGKLKIIGDIVN